MSSQYQVNIAISAGADFAEEFYLASPDKSPLNITGCKFIGALQKHPGGITISTKSEETDYVGIPFQPQYQMVWVACIKCLFPNQ